MKLSPNMEIVQNGTDEQFITWLMYIRDFTLDHWEKKLIVPMINERCERMNLEWHWGCCGTNVIRRKDDER